MKDKEITKPTFSGENAGEYINTEMGLVHSAILEVASKINAEKERLLMERLRLFLGEDIDLNKEMNRRFPRIMKEVEGGGSKETYFWDNGNEDGMGFPLITFHMDTSSEIYNLGGSYVCQFTYE